MIRSWGMVTFGAAAVPWFGDVLTAAFTPAGGRNNNSTVQVASTTRYRQGDRIILGAGQAGANILLVTGITDATHLSVRSEGASISAWPNGTIIALALSCADVIIQAVDSNVSPVWIGTDNTVTSSGGGTAFYELASLAIYRATFTGEYNTIRTTDGWVAGTATQKYLVSAVLI